MIDVDIKKLDYTLEDRGDHQTEVMNLIARDPDGNRYHLKNDEIDSYFYVPTEQVDTQLKTDDRVLRLEHDHESIRGDKLTKVYTYIPSHVPKLRGDYDHYEADILFPNRFSLDTDIYGGIEIPEDTPVNTPSEVALSDMERTGMSAPTRTMYCDIEVDDSNGFPDEEDGEEEIVCLSFYDNFKDQYYVYLYREDEPDVEIDMEYVDDVVVEVFDDEVDMLKAFAEFVCEMEPDVMAGWNFKKFDAMYLISRFETLGDLHPNMLSPLGSAYNDGWYGGKIKGVSVFDMLKGYKNLQFTELDSFKLEDVAREELGVGKLNEGEEKISHMWENDVEQLLEYNIRDVYLTVELEEVSGIIQFYEEVANFVGGRLSEVIDYSKAADIYVLRVVNDMFAVPSMDTISSQSDGEEFEGAEVFDPATEIKDMVSVLDLKSLYPMSMKTINAGPTTKDPDGNITAPNGVSFTTDHESVISGIIDNLLEEREAKKEQRNQFSPSSQKYVKYDLQQTAVKVIMNTLYGILGWERFRLYDEDVAAAVTAVGREVIKFTQREVNKLGYEVIYGDTDSVMVEFDDADNIREVIEASFAMAEHINNRYDDFAFEELNTKEHFFEIEFEKVYRKFMQAGKKKRYAGHIVWKEGEEVNKIDIVGLEVQRSDYSAKAKNLIKNVIDSILMGATKDEVSQLVRDEIERMKDLEYDYDDIGIPGGIGQAFEKYDTKTKHVRGAEYANENFGEEIQSGDKPKGIYVIRVGGDYPLPPQMSDSAFICWMNQSNVPDTVEIDWDKYMDIQIDGPISRIIECTEWSWAEIKTGQDQSGFTDFGGEETEDETDVFGEGFDSEPDNNSDDSGPSLEEFDQGEEAEETNGSGEDNSSGGIEVMSKEEIIEASEKEETDDDGQTQLGGFN